MSDGRLWLAIVALLGTTACGDTSGDQHSAVGTVPPIVALGPLPTRPPSTQDDVPSPTLPEPVRLTSIPTTTFLPSPTSTVTAASSTVAPAARKHTACRAVAYIGDSISLGMVTAATPPIPTAQFGAQMTAIGVTDLQVEVSGGRSIVETLAGQENAATVAGRLRDAGFTGCWVVAIGTNDAANIAAGGARQAGERIATMMSVIGRDPVLWIDAASIATDGFWAAPNIEAWDLLLTATAPSYPNIRVASWSTVVRPEWFEPDGVHITAAGAAGRVRFVADALVADFPQT
jgi:lysophospholipase L1-like esterase